MNDRLTELERVNATLTAEVRRLRIYFAVAVLAVVALALGSGNIARGVTAMLCVASASVGLPQIRESASCYKVPSLS